MSTQYKIFTTLVIVWMAVAASGCKKLVEVPAPNTSITLSEVFTSNAHANSAMAGLYSKMMSNSGSLTFSNGAISIYAGLSSDELLNFSGTTNLMDYQFYTNQLTSANGPVASYLWTPAYSVVYGANACIEGLTAAAPDALDDSIRNELTGEAKFIRAFCYFYLTNLFGDVPIVLSTDFNKTSLLAKSPQADVYKQIISDLKDAQSLLPKDFSVGKGERIRANYWAATALLARVYLYQKDWADAEAQASAVIGNSLFSLPTLANAFLKNSSESILQFQENATVLPYNTTWEAYEFVPTFRYTTYDPITQASLINPFLFPSYAAFLVAPYCLTNSFMTNFETGDKRRSTWTDSTATPSTAPYNSVPYYFAFKYTLKVSTLNGAITQYYTVLRLAEQYLIRAEARAQQGTNLTGAASDLNAVRTRAGLANTSASTSTDLLTAVAHERQVELFAEWGHRWLDLKRTGQASSVLSALSYKKPWSDNWLLYPIPVLDITDDPNLIQNTGY